MLAWSSASATASARFLEGKPMSTWAEVQPAMNKEAVNVMNRVSEPLEFPPAQFTPTPDKMPTVGPNLKRKFLSYTTKKFSNLSANCTTAFLPAKYIDLDDIYKTCRRIFILSNF